MLSKFLNLLKPAPLTQPIYDAQLVREQYKYRRIRICSSLFLGYAIFYFTRKSFTFAAPTMALELGLTKGQIGFLGAVLYMSYGISKFVSGALSDRSNPRYFMSLGLIATGVLNILFGMSSSYWLFVTFWGLNGWFQAWGWPACCKSLTYWFKQSERGLWYSITSTSHNVGGALIPIIAVFAATQFGWRYAMFVPAVISILMGLILINRLRDVPQSLGLPAAEHYEPEQPLCKDTCDTQKAAQPKEQGDMLSVTEIMFKHVLSNKFVWIFALTYFFVYVVRTAVNDWSMFYLEEVKGFSKMLAGNAVSLFELGGFVGMIFTGWGSDYFFKGNRVPVMVISAFGLILSVAGLWYTSESSIYLDMLFMWLIGFFVFGPQMMVGLAAAEFVDKRAASASNGFTGTLGYFGAAAALGGLGDVIQTWGWDIYYACLVVCSLMILILLAPFWSLKDPYRRDLVSQDNQLTSSS